jgi:hypothetical protein
VESYADSLVRINDDESAASVLLMLDNNTMSDDIYRLQEFIALIMKAARTSEASVYFNETTRRYVTEGCLSSHYFTMLN